DDWFRSACGSAHAAGRVQAPGSGATTLPWRVGPVVDRFRRSPRRGVPPGDRRRGRHGGCRRSIRRPPRRHARRADAARPHHRGPSPRAQRRQVGKTSGACEPQLAFDV
ncbi:MAG: hypothetical protein AVDCRST_MAG19-2283, partial [uncultured Thermomicrobiales bacterium]